MKINLKEFENFIRKATINYLFDYIFMEIKQDSVSTYMRTSERDVISVINLPNNILDDLDEDEYEWNFSEPSQNVIPLIKLFDDEIVNCEFKDNNKIILKKKPLKTNINLSNKQMSKIFIKKAAQESLNYFHTLDINEDFLNGYSKIKKVCSRLGGKIYFSIEDNKMFLETGNKSNPLSNNFKIELGPVDLYNIPKQYDKDENEIPLEFHLCYDFKIISPLMSIIEDENDLFQASFVFEMKRKLGMIYFRNKDETLNYYICSKKDL